MNNKSRSKEHLHPANPHLKKYILEENTAMNETDVMPGKSAEESLDPKDWESMRKLGHRILDDMMGLSGDTERSSSLATCAG